MTAPRSLPNVDDIYPLSPMQELMLLHQTTTPTSNVLTNQTRFRLTGALNPARLRRAWEQLLARHPALRTGFQWENLRQPLQIVSRDVPLAWELLDWRNLAAAEQDDRLSTLLSNDQQRPFDIRRPPLLRLTLIRLSDREAELVWTSHHLILDRWCIGLILNELLGSYGDAAVPAAAPAYRRYIQWLQRQDEAAAGEFWRRQLADIAQPTHLADGADPEPDPLATIRQRINLGADVQSGLRQAAARYQVTPHTLLQGAWAVVVAGLLNRSSVIYGLTVTGRPADLVGAGEIVGSLVNNVPVRVDVAPDRPVASWLADLLTARTAMADYEHCSPTEIQQWCGFPPGLPLFDNILVLQAPVHWDSPPDLTVTAIPSAPDTNYALTLHAELESDGLHVALLGDPSRISGRRLALLAGGLERVLAILAGQPERVGALLAAAPSPAGDTREPAAETPPPPAATRLPTSVIEARLLAFCRQLLAQPGLSVDADFFESGGTSLQAMALFSHVGEAFGARLPLSILLHARTPAGLAAVIAADSPDLRWSSLVEIQPQGDALPFFCVHGVTGDVLWFRDLGALLAPDRPFFGFEAVGLDGREEPLDSIETMAAAYVAEMRLLQPAGPYYLGGASFGGTVAVEMARQLTAAGEQVGMLIIFDHVPAPPPLVDWREKAAGAARIAANFPRWLGAIAAIGPRRILARARRKLRAGGERRAPDGDDAAVAGDLLDYGAELPPHRQRIIALNAAAIQRYEVEAVDCPVTLLKARSQPLLATWNPQARWRELTRGPLTVREIPGSHEGMFHQPHVHTLAAAVRTVLQ